MSEKLDRINELKEESMSAAAKRAGSDYRIAREDLDFVIRGPELSKSDEDRLSRAVEFLEAEEAKAKWFKQEELDIETADNTFAEELGAPSICSDCPAFKGMGEVVVALSRNKPDISFGGIILSYTAGLSHPRYFAYDPDNIKRGAVNTPEDYLTKKDRGELGRDRVALNLYFDAELCGGPIKERTLARKKCGVGMVNSGSEILKFNQTVEPKEEHIPVMRFIREQT